MLTTFLAYQPVERAYSIAAGDAEQKYFIMSVMSVKRFVLCAAIHSTYQVPSVGYPVMTSDIPLK